MSEKSFRTPLITREYVGILALVVMVAVFLVSVGISLAAAQETTGTIMGRVLDPQALPVPGAIVTVTSTQGARSFVTDIEGRFRAAFLVPGMYTLSVELTGFKTAVHRNIEVRLGQTVDLSLTLEIGAVSEIVTVAAAPAVIDMMSTTIGATLTTQMFSQIPVGRRFSDTIYIAPGVSSSGTAGRANPSMAGGTGLDNQYVIDGVNITNAGYGALGSYSIVFGSLGNGTPFDFMQEVQVKTGGYDAEYGQAWGGVVNVITKSGTNVMRGSAFGYSRPEQLESKWKQFQSVNGSVNTVATQLHDAGVEAGGPLLKDRLFFFGAVDPSWEARTLIAPEGFPLRSLGEVDRNRRIISYAAKGSWQLLADHRFDMSFFGDPATAENGPQRTSSLLRQTTSSFSALDEYGGHNQTVKYSGTLSSRWLLEASAARARNRIVEVPSVDEWNVTDRTVSPSVITGGIGFYEKGNDGKNLQYQVKSANLLRDHEIRYGLLFEDISYDQVNQRTGSTFVLPNAERTATGAQVIIQAEPAYGRIYRVSRANLNVSRHTEQQYWSGFVQDAWRLRDRLTIKAGLRYEQQKLVGTIVKDFALDGNWAPRIGATFDPIGTGKAKIFGNWGRFYAKIPNDLAARALSSDAGVARADYFDPQLTQPVPEGVQALGVTNHFILAGVGADTVDPNVKSSYLDETLVGFDYEILPKTNFAVRYIRRNVGRALEDIAPFPFAAYDLGLPGTGSVEYILTNPSPTTQVGAPELGAAFEKPIHNYDAVELTVDRRMTENWGVQASYSWSRLHGTFEGFYREDNGQSDPGITSLFDFPTNDPSYTAIGVPLFGYRGDVRYLGKLGEGPLPLDRPHQIKLFGNYVFPIRLNTGIGLTLSSGKPLTPFAGNPNYTNGGEIPEAPRGSGILTIDGVKKRTPFEYDLSLHADYGVALQRGQRLVLMVDAFNLLNLRRTIDYDNWTELSFGVPNPDFGKPVSQNLGGAPPQFQAPRQIRLGARLEF